jgi:voltage-gated potassium channel
VLRSDADNIYSVLAARSLRPDIFILSRCSQERSASKLRAAGADRVINPYERGGSLMAEVLLRPHVVDVVDQMFRGAGLEVFFEEVRVSESSALAGRSLKDSPIRRELDIIVTAIVKPGGGRSFNPSPDAVIDAADTLIVLGRSDAIDRLRAMAASVR